MTATIIIPASSMNIAGGTAGCWELRDGKVRLRPHSHLNAAHFCDTALGPLVVPAGPVSTNRVHFVDRALDSDWHCAGTLAIANPVYAGGY